MLLTKYISEIIKRFNIDKKEAHRLFQDIYPWALKNKKTSEEMYTEIKLQLTDAPPAILYGSQNPYTSVDIEYTGGNFHNAEW